MSGGHLQRRRPFLTNELVGEQAIRSNSGNDQARDNLHDPTMRDRELGRGEPAAGHKKPKAPADHRGGRKD